MVLSYLTVTRAPHRYIIIAVRAIFNNFVICDTKSIITSAGKYFIIKRTLFVFKKKFATTNNRKKYYGYNK